MTDLENDERRLKAAGNFTEGYDPCLAFKIALEFLNLQFDADIINKLSEKLSFEEGKIKKYLEMASEAQYLTPRRIVSEIEIEKNIEEKYNELFKLIEDDNPLKFVLVAASDQFDLPNYEKRKAWESVINPAANYFLGMVKHGDEVGFSGGRMPLALAKKICEKVYEQKIYEKYKDLQIQALAGNVDPNHINVSANSIVALISNLITGVKARGLDSFPIFAEGDIKQYRCDIERNQWIKDSIDKAKKVKFAFAGIGTIKDENFALKSLAKELKNYKILRKRDLEELDETVVGDILYIPFDKDGKIPNNPIVENIISRLIGITYDDLKDMAKNENKRVIAITGGSMKVQAIHAAIKGQLINALIIDDFTARCIVSECQNEIEQIKRRKII